MDFRVDHGPVVVPRRSTHGNNSMIDAKGWTAAPSGLESRRMERTSVTLAVVGAGNRGISYGRAAVASGRGRIVAVAEPDPVRRAAFAAEFGVPPAAVFDDWTELVGAGRLADAAIIATLDRLHVGPAVALLGQGWHVLLEKPMAPNEHDARRIADAATAAGTIFAVCHVLRYTPYTRALKRLLGDGRVGRVVSVQHLEPVGWWHQAHAFVRGNWRREDESGPMLLTKSCHDIDWLMDVVGQPVRRVSSFGGLSHLRPEQRPKGAADRCLDCAVEPECPYSAVRLYLGCLDDPEKRFWPLSTITHDLTEDGVRTALREGPYGRCVYACDNDVVDHQVVNLEFADGATAAFTMTAFARMAPRQTRIFGTHGSIEGDGVRLRLTDFRDGSVEVVDTATGHDGSAASGHGGGDAGLMADFLAAVAAGDPSLVGSNAAESLAGHLVVWAAERARRSGSVVTV
jgi:predicted dehydrogenase